MGVVVIYRSFQIGTLYALPTLQIILVAKRLTSMVKSSSGAQAA
jgi:hypothetical protein